LPGKRICIVTQSHLSRNPRVLKEAIALANSGYELHIVTSVFSTELLQQDRLAIQPYNITLHIVADHSQKNIPSFTDRLITRAGKLLVKKLGLQNPAALGYGHYKYFKICRDINAALYICHQELATYIGNKLIKAGYKVAFDLEDWYSEDLLPDARRSRPIKLLKKIEYYALHNGVYCTTTSKTLAHKLASVNKSPTPAVIYNIFPQQEIAEDSKTYSWPLKLFWFSQTIGPGRGLEGFISLLATFKTGIQLHLLGAVDMQYKSMLTNLLPSQHSIQFHAMVPEQELSDKIATFDIGLALELTQPPSRNYTITNKFFQYIQAGLPVIATHTKGQAEAFEKYQPGFKLPLTPGADDIAALEKWLSSPAELVNAAKRTKRAAAFYNWENKSKKIIRLVDNALK
jgi:glycosyltransferase involved in cell wall biosynthesis